MPGREYDGSDGRKMTASLKAKRNTVEKSISPLIDATPN